MVFYGGGLQVFVLLITVLWSIRRLHRNVFCYFDIDHFPYYAIKINTYLFQYTALLQHAPVEVEEQNEYRIQLGVGLGVSSGGREKQNPLRQHSPAFHSDRFGGQLQQQTPPSMTGAYLLHILQFVNHKNNRPPTLIEEPPPCADGTITHFPRKEMNATPNNNQKIISGM